ncbi:clathrin light chain 2 [Tripterygium wilfordii]|uniref:Clathrin light chain n=1 Tax=Tripterygium wilfordii TaxID=458696 RepID=A0A7J7CR48_TRIWF|nr:clathrin light chain 2-like [Tripterygium wilfordii]KAF5736582.1 clathrin light chain 2 [Tripterygium wilfordii]
MSTFNNSFIPLDDDSVESVLVPTTTLNFDDEDSLGYGHHIQSQRFGSLGGDSDSVKDSAIDDGPIFSSNNNGSSFSGVDGIFISTSEIYASGSEFEPLANGEEFGESNGPILPAPSEMEREERYALREWRRENAMRLEEKEKREKEVLRHIIEEADEYKVEFYRKGEIRCENNKITNREREKVFVANLEKFHAEVDKDYWKAIGQLIPNEVPPIEKKRGKKDQDKKPSITVIQGPKPGKPADLSRMRHILLKLKHNTPSHLQPSPPSQRGSASNTETGGTVVTAAVAVAVAVA